MGTKVSQITSLAIFTQSYIQAKIKETSKLRVTGLCAGNSPLTREFPAQIASNAENVSIWWRHHGIGDMFWPDGENTRRLRLLVVCPNMRCSREGTLIIKHTRYSWSATILGPDQCESLAYKKKNIQDRLHKDVNDCEVRGLFPWEMLTKMVISYLLNVEKNWSSVQINLSSTWNFYRKYFFDTTISTEKSTGEIDADLAHNEK